MAVRIHRVTYPHPLRVHLRQDGDSHKVVIIRDVVDEIIDSEFGVETSNVRKCRCERLGSDCKWHPYPEGAIFDDGDFVTTGAIAPIHKGGWNYFDGPIVTDPETDAELAALLFEETKERAQ